MLVVRIAMTEELLEAFVEASGIVVPEDLLEEAIEQMTVEVLHRKRYECMAAGRALTSEEIKQFAEKIPSMARNQIKTRLVLEDIIEKQAFEISREELEEEADALAERQHMTVEAVRDFLGEDLASLRDDILIRKAIDYITTQDNA